MGKNGESQFHVGNTSSNGPVFVCYVSLLECIISKKIEWGNNALLDDNFRKSSVVGSFLLFPKGADLEEMHRGFEGSKIQITLMKLFLHMFHDFSMNLRC